MKPFQLHIIKINHSFYQLSHRKIRLQYRIRRNLLRPLQTSDQLLHSSPTSNASPIKRSKRGSTPYFNIKLQTALATQPAVCFSHSKRSFFDEKAATKTALKIERYITSQDGHMIFINDMTRLSSPATSEYNFQFVQSYNSNTLTLQSILQNGLDMDMIDVIAKVKYKDKESQIVGSRKLKKSTCYIADETANSKLILWENNIEDLLVTYTKDMYAKIPQVPQPRDIGICEHRHCSVTFQM